MPCMCSFLQACPQCSLIIAGGRVGVGQGLTDRPCFAEEEASKGRNVGQGLLLTSEVLGYDKTGKL